MERTIHDLKLAVRGLWKDRSFAATTLATLALCLAANTAIFAVVNTVLLQPLPFEEPHRLVTVANAYPGAGLERGLANGVPDYYDRLRDIDAFEELAMYRTSGATIGGVGADPERVTSMPATPSLFRILRIQPLRGRVFTEEEGEVGQDRKVVLSYGLWQRLYAGRDSALGQELRINGTPHLIVGVMPADFWFIDPDVELWTAAAFPPEERADNRRHSNNWQQIARLEPGATIEQAQAQIDALNARNLDRVPNLREALVNARFRTHVAFLQHELVRDIRPTVYLLWAGAFIVLVIGCVNVANLVSVRATARLRELATRAALGASLGRLSRQLLTETVLLSVIGGVTGGLLAWWALSAAPLLGFDELPRGHEIALDGSALGFAFALVVFVGLIVGLSPVVALRRTNLALVVREEGRSGTATRGTRVIRRVLVTSQVAFALLLLVGAGLLLASFERVLAVDPGFEGTYVITGNLSLPATRYKDESALRSTTERLLNELRSMPGVEAAGVTTTIPFGGSYSDGVILAEGYQMAPGESLVSPNNVTVSDGYFEAMKVRLLEGRFFDARDHEASPRAIIVDEPLARRFWPGVSALGRRMYLPGSGEKLLEPPPEKDMFTVVGVIAEMKLVGLVDPAGLRRVGAYYFPARQRPPRTVTVAIRTAQDPVTLVSSVRQQLAKVDPELPFYSVQSMEERMSKSLIDRRTPMLLGTGFAAVALFLSAIGIYGMLAYQVSQRAREIGIRMALGAGASNIFRMVLTEGAAIVAVGSLFGLLGAFLLRRTLQSQLYGIGAMDPGVLAGVAGLLATVALVACVLPARRAARTDPIVALSE